jgi:hypothetical protein
MAATAVTGRPNSPSRGRGRLRRVAVHGIAALALLVPAAAADASGPRGPQLVFSTYLGGAYKYGDIGNAIAVDAGGDAYVTGRSYYSRFPTTPGAFQTEHHSVGPWDTSAFAAKLNSSGSGLVYSTYLAAGAGETTGEGIAVDATGHAYVAGHTTATDYPVTPGAVDNGDQGIFVTKLNPEGSGLDYSGLLGSGVYAGGIAVGPGGSAYVAAGAAMKLDPSGGGLVYSRSLDKATIADVALDSAGNLYVAGTAGEGFQTTAGAFRGSPSGAFAAKIDPDGNVVYATLLGDRSSSADAIAVDAAGDAYVAGATESRRFPTTRGAFQTAVRGGKGPNETAFVVRLDPAGTGRIYSTYLGEPSHGGPCGCGGASGIAVDAAGDAFVAGTTASRRFPTTTGALQRRKRSRPSYAGSPFLSELDPLGRRLRYSTYLGGNGSDFASDVALGPGGRAYLTGGVVSTDFPVTPGALQRRSHGDYAVFVTALDPAGAPVPGLFVKAVQRRGDRLRLRGAVDPRARGALAGTARLGTVTRPLHLRRRGGRFTATSEPLGRGGAWRLTIRFAGEGAWEDGSVCRETRIAGKRPGRWARARARGC